MKNKEILWILFCILVTVKTSIMVKTKLPIVVARPKQNGILDEIDPNLDSDLGPANEAITTEESLVQFVQNIEALPTNMTNFENPSSPANGEEDSSVNANDPNPINKFCTCTQNSCNCCRTFKLPIPIIPVRGPGCATVRYAGNEKVSLTIKYGDIVLASRTISGKNSQPICLPLPGGFTHFCGRVYGLTKGQDDFRACLGLELRADESTEAAVRVSCFKFGEKGLAVAEAEPFPTNEKNEEDDDDFLGFGAADDEADDDDDYDGDTEDEDYGGLEYESGNENVDSPDYGGFSIFDGLFDSQRSIK